MTPNPDFQYRTVELRKGVRVHAVTTGRFKTAALSVHFAVPMKSETAPAYMLLGDVLTRGTEKHPTMQELNRVTDDLYSLGINAYSRTFGELQMVRFGLTCVEDDFTFEKMPLLKESVGLLKEIMFSPCLENGVFRADYLEQEKKNLCDGILARINDKDRYAHIRCVASMCADEPYSVTARMTPEDVRNVTGPFAFSAYRDLLGNAPVEIVYVGRKSAEEVADLLRDIPLPERDPLRMPAPGNIRPDSVRTVRETAQIQQCKLVIGFRTVGVDTRRKRMAMALFHEMFSASPVSRLFMNVREKKHLCYYCSGDPDPLKGVYFVASATRNEHADDVRAAVLSELEALRNGNFESEELSMAKKSLTHAILETADSPLSVAASRLTSVLRGTVPDLEERVRFVESLGAEDVSAAAASLAEDTVFVLEGGASE
ncbi:MAG: insulinase family protein [Clostridia bacterium]|nr:insulinase family protein [Clostridia bacterium]